MNTATSACFVELLKEVPQWLDELTVVVESVELWRLKHGKQDSIRLGVLEDSSSLVALQKQDTTQGEWQRPTRIPAAVRRKDAARPTRRISVVHYDQGIQKQVERLVGMISIGRSLIRKNRPAAPFSPLRVDSVTGTFGLTAMPCPAFLSTFRKRSIPDQGHENLTTKDKAGSTKALNDIDDSLKEAQASCEKVAHQLLRDGDCDHDLDLVKQALDRIISVCAVHITEAQHIVKDPVVGPVERRSAVKKLKYEEGVRADSNFDEYTESVTSSSVLLHRYPQLTAH